MRQDMLVLRMRVSPIRLLHVPFGRAQIRRDGDYVTFGREQIALGHGIDWVVNVK